METTENKHIDLSYLKELSNGSNEFICQMISIFILQTPEAIDNMEMHLNNKDWKRLKATAHKMKPSFSFMGIKELENSIFLVEEYCEKEMHFEQLPELIAKIRNICSLAIIELEEEKKKFE